MNARFCRDLMTRDVKFCLPEDSAQHASRIMSIDQVGALPVVSDPESQNLVGILTERDIAVRVTALGLDPKTVKVHQIMSAMPIRCRLDDDVSRASHAMLEFNLRRIPVVDSTSRLMGILSRSDMAAANKIT